MGVGDDHHALLDRWLEQAELDAGIREHPTHHHWTPSPEYELRRLIAQARYLAEHYAVNAKGLAEDARSADVHGEHLASKALMKAARDAQHNADRWQEILEELETEGI